MQHTRKTRDDLTFPQQHQTVGLAGKFAGKTLVIAAVHFLFLLVSSRLLPFDSPYGPVLGPASGLALTILLKEGQRYWLSIWIAGLASLSVHATNDLALLNRVIISSAMAAQALLGTYFAKRFFNSDMPLVKESNLLLLLLLAGPVACTVMPTCLILLAATDSRIDTISDALRMWSHIWIGNTFGVVAFGPLAMLAWPGPPRPWKGSEFSIAAVLTIGIGAMFAGYHLLTVQRQATTREFYRLAAHEVFETTEEAIQATCTSIANVGNLFATRPRMTAQTFSDITFFAYSKPEILTVDWAPLVTDTELEKFVSEVRKTTQINYQVFARDATGQRVSPPKQPEHFPILYRSPRRSEIETIGQDYSVGESWSSAIAQARRTGEPAITAVMNGYRGLSTALSFQPIYTKTSITQDSKLLGFIVISFDLKPIFSHLRKLAKARNLGIRVTHTTADGISQTLIDDISANETTIWRHDIETANAPIHIEMGILQPNPYNVQRLEIEANNFFGLLVVTLFSFSVLSLATRQTAIKQAVTSRTAEIMKLKYDAETANRAKSTFLSTMSHEIRTPMNGLLGSLELLEQSALLEYQRDFVATMRTSASTLLALISDILDFSKIEANKLELEKLPVCIADLVEDICISEASTALTHGVVLHVFVEPDLPIAVLGDHIRLRQILYNLINNAIKFSGKNPTRPGRVSVQVKIAISHPLQIAFSVEDNGIGMNAATQNRLFTPFSQGEVSTTRRFGGTGLGLTICRRLVSLMGGKITVSSTLGEGSVFNATIPFVLAAQQPTYDHVDLSGITCLLLEDDAFEAGHLLRYLEHAGAQGQRCRDLTEVVNHAEKIEARKVLILFIDENKYQRACELPVGLPEVRISLGRRRGVRVRESGHVSIDINALRRRTLLQAVAIAAGQQPAEPPNITAADASTRKPGLPPITSQSRDGNPLILVAEDDNVNQKVILQQLAVAGFSGEIAGDGRKALELWQRGDFALVLTDLHMPTMDGYELAKEIRRIDGPNKHTPIIALTADALRDGMQEIRASGIDAVITKPITISRLRETLETWLPFTDNDERISKSTPLVDRAVLPQLVGDDPAVIRSLLLEYVSSATEAAATLRATYKTGDFGQITHFSHRLKSSSRAVGAMSFGDLCAELESAGIRHDREAMERHMSEFDAMFPKVLDGLNELLFDANDKNSRR